MREERQHHKYLQKKSRERKREKTSMRKKMRGVVKPGQEAEVSVQCREGYERGLMQVVTEERGCKARGQNVMGPEKCPSACVRVS